MWKLFGVLLFLLGAVFLMGFLEENGDDIIRWIKEGIDIRESKKHTFLGLRYDKKKRNPYSQAMMYNTQKNHKSLKRKNK